MIKRFHNFVLVSDEQICFFLFAKVANHALEIASMAIYSQFVFSSTKGAQSIALPKDDLFFL